MRKLSIIIPAYNEEASIGPLLEKVLSVPLEATGFTKEIIVVDDGSRDRTAEIVSRFNSVRLIRQANAGKGRAVQRGVSESTGDYILIQDADLEYNPDDYIPMLRMIPENGFVSVYGSRTLGQLRRGWSLFPGRHPKQGIGPWIAGAILTLWAGLLYRKWITDTLTAYKVYPSAVLKSFSIKTHGFETDHEITAKLVKSGIPITEVPIDYIPRSVAEGKKISAKDGVIAVWTLLRFRFCN